MKQLTEMDLGIEDDGFVATGDNEDQVVDTMLEHVRNNHHDWMKKMAHKKSEDEIRADLMAQVHEA